MTRNNKRRVLRGRKTDEFPRKSKYGGTKWSRLIPGDTCPSHDQWIAEHGTKTQKRALASRSIATT